MRFQYLICLALVLVTSCSSPGGLAENSAEFTVANSLSEPRKDAFFRIAADRITKVPGQDWSTMKLVAGGETIPFEAMDTDGDGLSDQLGVLLQMKAGERKKLTLQALAEGEKAPVFPKRTYAELSHKTGGYWKEREYQEGVFKNVDVLQVPQEHTDHSWFIRYEGPGWESDLVGYRFYLDWRNANDIFGKKTTEMVLDRVGQDGFDSYHEPADWGQDILKVGSSLGLGSIATWTDDHALRVEETDSLACEVVRNGKLESLIRTNYYGWKVGSVKTNLTADLSIHAGSRLTKVELNLSNPLPNLCTGIGKLKNAELLTGGEGDWAYLATWGAQSLAEDNLGMAVLYRKSDLLELTEDELSHVVVLRPNNNSLNYYFLAAWEQEPGGIKDRASFLTYLDKTTRELDAPISASVSR
ncbi:MAG: DUF4861 domain-containing protein [Lewinella sp.]